jgi:hypothetical protein
MAAIAGAAPAGAPAAAPLIADAPAFLPTTILPTDVVPLPATSTRLGIGENMQMRILQSLPPQFYLNASVETSFRDETNPFQDPTRRTYIHNTAPLNEPADFRELPIEQQLQDLAPLAHINENNVIFRVLPNVTAGWALTPATRIYSNYFFIRDSLMHSVSLNTNINSIAYGAQHDFAIGKRANLQTDFQVRALMQLHNRPFYDFLPGATLSYQVSPRVVAYVNSLLQLRGRWYYQSPTREMDPFYTFGASYQNGVWALSANATFLQNFRKNFGREAIIPQNSYSWIADFEIARRLFKGFSGAQSFVRAEPVWNFHSKQTPGLAGMDFRIYFGVRVALSKPPISQALQQIREQVEEEEKMNKKEKEKETPPPPSEENAKPSAFIMPYERTAFSIQPIHGFDGLTVQLGDDTADGISNLASLHSPESVSSVDNAQVISNASSASDAPAASQSHLYAL